MLLRPLVMLKKLKAESSKLPIRVRILNQPKKHTKTSYNVKCKTTQNVPQAECDRAHQHKCAKYKIHEENTHIISSIHVKTYKLFTSRPERITF